MKRIRQKFSNQKIGYINLIVYVFRRGLVPLLRFWLFKFTSFGSYSFISFIGSNCEIMHTRYLKTGRNFYLGSGSSISCLTDGSFIRIGDNVTIRERAWLQVTSRLDNPGIGLEIGDFTYIGPGVVLGGAAKLIIGSRCQIGSYVCFSAENHSFESEKSIFDQGVSRIGIQIGNDCWIGNHVSILDGVSIGNGCVVGAGSVVTKSFPDNSIVMGIPARLVRSR